MRKIDTYSKSVCENSHIFTVKTAAIVAVEHRDTVNRDTMKQQDGHTWWITCASCTIIGLYVLSTHSMHTDAYIARMTQPKHANGTQSIHNKRNLYNAIKNDDVYDVYRTMQTIRYDHN